MDDRLFRENESYRQGTDGLKFFELGDFCVGETQLPKAQIAFQTWGELNADASNTILVCHALSGDSNAVGWWSRLVGPGKAIDTERYFVIGSNVLGGCQGSTGPSSLAADGKPYGSRFPRLTLEDIVRGQVELVRGLGISQLFAAVGGSLGGMQALEWTRQAPPKKAWITASAPAHGAMQIGFNEVARQAILRDPHFAGGDYYDGPAPVGGLTVARMVGHLTYLSDTSFEAKFGRRLQDGREHLGREMFQIESYLAHQGSKFTQRFDANSLISLTNAIDTYQYEPIPGTPTEFLVTSFTSDWIYSASQSERLVEMLTEAGCRVRWENLDVPYGHDSFLLDDVEQERAVKAFLG